MSTCSWFHSTKIVNIDNRRRKLLVLNKQHVQVRVDISHTQRQVQFQSQFQLSLSLNEDQSWGCFSEGLLNPLALTLPNLNKPAYRLQACVPGLFSMIIDRIDIIMSELTIPCRRSREPNSSLHEDQSWGCFSEELLNPLALPLPNLNKPA